MALVSSDRSSLIPAVTQSERPQGWDETTVVETGELHPVAEQASCCRTSIPSVGTPPQLRGLEARTQRNTTVFTGWGGNQAALALAFPDSWKASQTTLNSSWHKLLVYVEFATTSFLITTTLAIFYCFMGCMLGCLFCLKESCSEVMTVQ